MAVEGFAGANRVFISCVSDEFEKPSAPYPGFRSALRDYLAQADCEVKVQEQFRQEGSLDTVEKLAGYIKTCQAVIHLLGEKSGSIADPQAVADFLENEKDFLAKYPELRTEFGDCSDLTYTQWEAFLALHYGVDLFVYVTKEGKDAQKTHLDRLKLARKYADEIKSDTDLLGKLIGDLRKIIPSIPELVQEIDTSRLLRQGHTAEYFLGREDELAFLDSVWQRRINVVSLIAWGGVGKTSLLCEWLQRRFIDQDWKDESGEPSVWRFFDWSFYDQGTGGLEEREVRTGSVGDFFEQALTFFGDPQPNLPNKGKRLAEYIRRQHSLLLLDGLEPLQYPPGSIQAGQLLDGDLADLLLALAQRNPGLCLLTSRQAVKELDGLHGRASEQKDLEELAKPVAVELLRKLQVTGSDEDLEHACDQFGCHALSLTLLGRFLFDVHGGDVRRVDRIRDLERADQLTREDRHRTVWKVLQAYEEWLASATSADQPKTLAVLRLMGLFDRRATPDCLSALRAEPAIPGLTEALVEMADDEWAILLQKLARARLLKLDIPEHQPEQISIDAHPLIREYFAQQLKKEQPEAFRAAHSRLFDHLCETTKPHQPDTLLGLQPLYEAVTHGCLAGRHQEACDKVYVDRILRGMESDGFYSTRQLGAIGADLGAVAAFFDVPWSQVSQNLKESDQAWLLSQAAFRLRALGRLTEALEPMRSALEMAINAKNWKSAAVRASNLSELEVTLGQLPQAVTDGRRAVDFADLSGEEFHRVSKRATAADALHQSGATAEARHLFADAETMQTKMQPDYPLLYSTRGFRYVDLLLAPAEQAAWQVLLDEASKSEFLNAQRSSLNEICKDADQRGQYALDIVMSGSRNLLDIALNHLTLTRSALYRALFSGDVPKTLATQVTTALSALRKANTVDHLPKTLLTAAWYYATLGEQPDEAKRLLEETEQIAKRGPMPLYLADVHLHRARLFRDRAELAKARGLIEKHGYGRRLPELAGAEAAAVGWR